MEPFVQYKIKAIRLEIIRMNHLQCQQARPNPPRRNSIGCTVSLQLLLLYEYYDNKDDFAWYRRADCSLQIRKQHTYWPDIFYECLRPISTHRILYWQAVLGL